MNREEVIRILGETTLCTPLGQAAFAAIKDVKKQIAKQPTEIKSVDFTGSIRNSFKNGNCPCCNAHVDTDDNRKFCSECGQKLDWEN